MIIFLMRLVTFILVILIVLFLWFGYEVSQNSPIAEKDYKDIVRPYPSFIPEWFNKIPLLSTEIASSVYPKIYLPKDQYAEFTSGEMSVWTQSVLVHEMSHLVRREEDHPLIQGVKYLLFKDYRLHDELLAIQAQMEFLKENGTEYRIEWKAKQFAGREYGHMISEDKAIEILTHLWQTGEIKTD